MMQQSTIRLMIISLVFLSSCSGGGSSTPPIREDGEIKGKVVDAVLVGATIKVYEWNQGNIITDVIAETVTDNAGHYILTPNYKDAYFILKATGGAYIEEATGTQVNLQEGQELTALVRYESGTAIDLHLSVMTHWAACQSQWRAKTQGNNNSDAVGLSYDVFSAMAGVAIREVEPLNITDPNNASPVINEGLQYGIYPAAISSLTKDMAERSGQAPHTLTSTTSIHLAQIGCNDIRADGRLDGQGFTNDEIQISPLAFGTVSLTPRIYRTEIAQHMLIMASSDLNKTGLGATDFLSRAQSLSTMDSDVFDKITPEPVDLNGPVISNNLPEDTFLKGTANLVFTIDDPLGITKVEYYIDGDFVSNGSEGNTTFAIDTTAYSDGPHEIKVLAYDALDNEGTFVRNYNIDNSGPIVTVTSPTLVGNTSYPATGTFQVDGAAIKKITVNGIAAVLDVPNNTWSAVVNLAAGNKNALVVQAEDNNGTFGTEVTVNVAVDTVPPKLLNADTPVSTSTGQNQFALCNNETMEFIKDVAICIRDDRVSLNGEVISSDLIDDSFVLIGYQVIDLPVDGIFTSVDELIVEFKVEKDGVLINDWLPAPAKNADDAIRYLPLTTEYLGDNWFQASITSVFKIGFRVTDQAGHSILREYTMSFDVLPSTITITTSLPNETILKDTPFKNRSTVDSQDFNVEYKYVNGSSIGYYLFLEESTNNTVLHSYETAIRKNKARVKVEEQWFASWMKCTGANADNCVQQGAEEQVNALVSIGPMTIPNRIKTIFPQTVFTSYQDVFKDTITVGIDIAEPSLTSQYICDVRVATPYSVVENVDVFTTLPKGLVCEYHSNHQGVSAVFHDFLRIVRAKSVEYFTGYPFTDSSIFDYPVANIPGNPIKVFNDTVTTGEIFPTNGWYLIPPDTTARIIKTIRLPVLIHENDQDVADLTTFTSYTERRLDKSTTWNIDSDLTITRVVDPGDPSLINSQTQTTQIFGEGIKSYTIGR